MDYRTSTVYSFLMHSAYGRIGLLSPSSIYVRYHRVKARATREKKKNEKHHYQELQKKKELMSNTDNKQEKLS